MGRALLETAWAASAEAIMRRSQDVRRIKARRGDAEGDGEGGKGADRTRTGGRVETRTRRESRPRPTGNSSRAVSPALPLPPPAPLPALTFASVWHRWRGLLRPFLNSPASPSLSFINSEHMYMHCLAHSSRRRATHIEGCVRGQSVILAETIHRGQRQCTSANRSISF